MKPMTNIRRESAGWVVRLVRDGVEYSKYFRFTNGGVRGSLKLARAWRDKQFRRHGERTWREGPNRKKATNNTSGVIGVSKTPDGHWVASWNESGKQRFKRFRTKREAIAHRKAQEKRLSK